MKIIIVVLLFLFPIALMSGYFVYNRTIEEFNISDRVDYSIIASSELINNYLDSVKLDEYSYQNLSMLDRVLMIITQRGNDKNKSALIDGFLSKQLLSNRISSRTLNWHFSNLIVSEWISNNLSIGQIIGNVECNNEYYKIEESLKNINELDEIRSMFGREVKIGQAKSVIKGLVKIVDDGGEFEVYTFHTMYHEIIIWTKNGSSKIIDHMHYKKNAVM